ncbi:MAG: phosphotransferase [Myxococcales bacterium]|nr:phosphotransferase [Myxococcales bacterium]
MATFTVLDLADAAAIARAADLGPVTALAPIDAGTINSNFALTCADRRWMVRVNEGKHPDDVSWEGDLVAALAAAGLPTPVPRAIAGRRWLAHRGLVISVFPWVDGTIRDAAAVSLADAARLGDALGLLHQGAAARWPAHGRAGFYQWADVVGRLDAIRAAARPELAAPLVELTAASAELAARVADRAAARHGIIHNDLFRDNVLWQGDAISAVLDFEQAATGALVYDVAVAINDWCWHDGVRAEHARALIEAHQRRVPWTAADRAALGLELVAAATRFTITRLTDVYLRQVDKPDKDYRAFLARLRFWRSLQGRRLGRAWRCRDAARSLLVSSSMSLHSRAALVALALAAVATGCARRSSTIPGTRINDDRINREILATIEQYRVAVEKGDAEALFLMASENYNEDSGTAGGEDDYGYDGLKEVLVGRFRMASDIRFAMKYVSIHRGCPAADELPVGCVAKVEALIDASFTIVDARGHDRRTDKRDQNELVLEWSGDRWKFVAGL